MIINDLVRPVIGKLRQRTDLINAIPYFIAQVILDLTENTEFEELKVTGPLTNFVPNIAEYPLRGYDVNGITGNPFVAAENHRITQIVNWFVYFQTNGQITIGQSTGKNIDQRDIRVVDPMSKILGIPSVCCFYGDKISNGSVIVGQMPDNPYPTYMRYQKEHPFNIPYEYVLQSRFDNDLSVKLATSQILMPRDWTDIIVYAAAEKACDDVGMNEIGMQYHQKLYGYKDKKGNEMPGLITVRLTQQERQSDRNSRALRPVVRRCTG
jgi:hypothetical protein